MIATITVLAEQTESEVRVGGQINDSDPHTTHAIPREDPELIVWAIRRVLAAVQ